MAYYDKIAQQWHAATGYNGGAFKEHVLNAVLLQKLPAIDNCSILELGAGNGYFLPLVLRRFSGQTPASILVTDCSNELLEIARTNFRIPQAQYQRLDMCGAFPFEDNTFDIILAIMVLNEVPPKGFKNALRECHRILSAKGVFLFAVTHPDFIDSLQKKGLLKRIAGRPAHHARLWQSSSAGHHPLACHLPGWPGRNRVPVWRRTALSDRQSPEGKTGLAQCWSSSDRARFPVYKICECQPASFFAGNWKHPPLKARSMSPNLEIEAL